MRSNPGNANKKRLEPCKGSPITEPLQVVAALQPWAGISQRLRRKTEDSSLLIPIVAGSNIINVENLMSAEVVRAGWLCNTGEPLFRIAKRGANRERRGHEEHFLFESDS